MYNKQAVLEASEYFINGNTINIFTDASIKRIRKEWAYIGCPGFIVYLGNTQLYQYTEILNFATNNESEARAVYLALDYIINYLSPNLFNVSRINIFCDSKLTVYAVREWYKSWFNSVDQQGILYNSSGLPVINQRYYVDIMRQVLAINRPINFYHVKGHTTLNTKSIEVFNNTFIRENKLSSKYKTLTYTLTKFLADGNNKVDFITGLDVDYLNTENITIPYSKKDLESPFIYTDLLKSIDLKRYYQLTSQFNLL